MGGFRCCVSSWHLHASAVSLFMCSHVQLTSDNQFRSLTPLTCKMHLCRFAVFSQNAATNCTNTPSTSEHVGAFSCDNGAAYQSTCTAICSDGYTGTVTAICGSDKLFTPTGTCSPNSKCDAALRLQTSYVLHVREALSHVY